MSNLRSKKIRRLGKAHTWPSILFLVLSVVLSAAVFLGFVVITMSMLMQDRFTSVISDASAVGRLIDAAGSGRGAVIDNIRSEATFSDAVLILDKDKNVVEGFGEASYDLDSRVKIEENLIFGEGEFDGNYTLLVDKGFADNLVDEEGSLKLTKLLKFSNYSDWFGKKPDMKDVAFEARFWVGCDLKNGEISLVKCSVPLYVNDFARALVTGVIAFAVMLLPVIFFFINVIISHANQRKMRKLLYTDTVTGGNNFIYFEHNTGKALESRFSSGKLFAVADITVTKYRSYCNYHGVRSGEALLEDVDKNIKAALGKGEMVAHSGKSSFAVFFRCTDKASCEGRLDGLLTKLGDRYKSVSVAFHAGLYYSEPERTADGKATLTTRIKDPADCFNRASAARSVLTDENNTAYAVYDDKLLEEQLWEHRVEEKMEGALAREEFKVYVQPKYNPVTNKLAGAEALVRWINEEDGFISPGKFIPIFEKNGFITKLDDYMLAHVAAFQAQWIMDGKDVVPISVNVSRAHFADPGLAEHISNIVDRFSVPHHLIEIELTESAFFDDKAALLRTVHSLREKGFEISMDDFGAGYSSLNSLKDLPLDVLKLDADFFRGESEENRGEIVVSEAIALAKKLNMRIVAEGVEKKEQVDFLAKQGCDMIQGFYFAKPMPAADYSKELPDGKPAQAAGAAQEAAPEAVLQEVSPEAVPQESAPEAVPQDVVPEAVSEFIPQEVTPETVSEVTPEVTPEEAPESADGEAQSV